MIVNRGFVSRCEPPELIAACRSHEQFASNCHVLRLIAHSWINAKSLQRQKHPWLVAEILFSIMCMFSFCHPNGVICGHTDGNEDAVHHHTMRVQNNLESVLLYVGLLPLPHFCYVCMPSLSTTLKAGGGFSESYGYSLGMLSIKY